MDTRGKIHMNANDTNLGYRSRKLYNYQNMHNNKNHEIFTNYFPYQDEQLEKKAHQIDSPLL